MEGSGANFNRVTAINEDRVEHEFEVLASADVVQIGAWTFQRDELLLAMGAMTRAPRMHAVVGEPAVVDPSLVLDLALEDSGGGAVS